MLDLFCFVYLFFPFSRLFSIYGFFIVYLVFMVVKLCLKSLYFIL